MLRKSRALGGPIPCIETLEDQSPALFENSLSNKGQLSAWKIAEVADLLSIVENLYRQGGEMSFADPLQSLCAHRRVVRPLNPKKASCVVRTLTTGSKKQRTHASVCWQGHLCSWTARSKVEEAYELHIARETTHEGNRSNRIPHWNRRCQQVCQRNYSINQGLEAFCYTHANIIDKRDRETRECRRTACSRHWDSKESRLHVQDCLSLKLGNMASPGPTFNIFTTTTWKKLAWTKCRRSSNTIHITKRCERAPSYAIKPMRQ